MNDKLNSEEYQNQLYEMRKKAYKQHKLAGLFLEVTSRCNARCEHCGSSCGDFIPKNEVKKESWWHGVKSEFKKVRWPSKKEMIKYSIATILFIIFFAVFFWIIELVAWLIKTM